MLDRSDIEDIGRIITDKTGAQFATLTTEMSGVNQSISRIEGTQERMFKMMGDYPSKPYCEQVQRAVAAELTGVRGIAEEAREDVDDAIGDLNKGKGAISAVLWILGFIGVTGLITGGIAFANMFLNFVGRVNP